MTPLESSHPSRRQMMEQLSTLLGGAALGPLAGCSSSKQSKEGSSTETVDDESMDPPKIDMAAMSDALGLALAALPMGTDADALLANVQAEIDALHAAGLTETSQWYAGCIDDVLTPMLGNLAGVLPANGSVDEETAQRMGQELINSLQVGMAALSPKLGEVSEELKGALGGDTSEPSPEVTNSLAEHEVALRQWMHAMEVEDGNLSGQAAAMLLMNQMQGVRAESVKPLSLDETVEQLQAALDNFGLDASAASEGSGAARSVTPPSWRRHGYEGPPPPDWEFTCEVVSNITFLIECTMGITAMIKGFNAAKSEAYGKWVVGILSDLKWEVDRATSVWARTLTLSTIGNNATTAAEFAANRVLSLGNDFEGEFVEEDCNWYAAFILTIVVMLQIALAFYTMFTIVSKLGAELALATGLYAPAPLLAGAVIWVLMLAIIVLYVLSICCLVTDLLPAIEVLFGECEA